MDNIGDIFKKLGYEKGGKDTTMPEESYRCQKCRDQGYLHPVGLDGRVDYARTVSCECRRELLEKTRIIKLTQMCELPAATEDYTFEKFVPRPELSEALDYSRRLAAGDDNLKWLTLVGGVDVGKTHLAIAICREWLLAGRPAKYAYVPLLLDELRRGYNATNENSYDYRYRIYLTIPLLVLDDLGAERGTDWAREKLDTIVDYRAVHGLPLVVTTNLVMEELPIRLANRLIRVPFGKVLYIDASQFYKQNRYEGKAQ